MDQNIKYAIYFLLGIIIYYLLFNEKNGVEGFDVDFIYVTQGDNTIRLNKVDTALTTLTTPTDGITAEYTRIIADVSNYYKNVEGEVTTLFIQKNSTEGSCTACTAEQVAAAGTEGACRGEGSSCDTYTTRGECVAVPNCIFAPSTATGNPAAGENGGCVGCSIAQGTAGTTASTQRTADGCLAVGAACDGATHNDCDDNCVFTPTVVSYLIKKTDTAITSIHKITQDLSTITGTTTYTINIVGTGDSTTLQVYVTSSSAYNPSPATTTITIDTIPRCKTPTNASGGAYILNDTKVLTIDDFNVSGTCADDYTGNFSSATVCTSDNEMYNLSGCSAEPGSSACTPNPCRHGGVCQTTNSGYSCDCVAGYTGVHCQTPPITSPINASCSTYITETNKCPDGKSKIDDKNCSGACSKVVCCEDDDIYIYIGIGVLILCLILIPLAIYLLGSKTGQVKQFKREVKQDMYYDKLGKGHEINILKEKPDASQIDSISNYGT